MQINIQTTAYVILAVGFLVLGFKFFPNLKKWLTTGKVSYVWLVVITLGLFVMLTYPYFFNWWAINFWGVSEGELSDLGPLGDIYGSLNSFISSIALCAVAYSTILQIKELRLSRMAYKEQLSETKYANFSNLFYSLLNHKQTKYNNFRISNPDDNFDSIRIFNAISKRLLTLVKNEWNNAEKLKSDTVKKEFHIFLLNLTKKNATSQELNSYFLIYGDLLNLVNRSGLTLEDEKFFKEIIRNSMTMSEQATLFWMASYIGRYKIFLKDSGVFNQFFHKDLMSFAKKFYDESYFSNAKFLENWNIDPAEIEDTEKETPA